MKRYFIQVVYNFIFISQEPFVKKCKINLFHFKCRYFIFHKIFKNNFFTDKFNEDVIDFLNVNETRIHLFSNYKLAF